MDLSIPIKNHTLEGILTVPEHATGLVIFVHGSGSSRFSTRNLYVAKVLNQANIATLLFDLLTPEEEQIDRYTAEFRFDIARLKQRLQEVTHWCHKQPALAKLQLAYFGASTGAAAALFAAAALPKLIKAVVSRGGRPDLAEPALTQLKAPTLLMVGELDVAVIALNQTAYQQMTCSKALKIIPGASHLFEEAGCLEQVAILASAWFRKYFL